MAGPLSDRMRALQVDTQRAAFNENLAGVVGWLSPRERQALYACARRLGGPVLEIGPWVGLNAAGLRPFLAPGMVLACHDITPGNAVCLRQPLPLGTPFQVDSLFVGEVAPGGAAA